MKMKEIANLKEEFIKELKKKIPPKVLELGLEFIKKQPGGIRLEYNVRGELKIAAVYVGGLGKKCNPIDPAWPILKFQNKNFNDDVEPSFVFQGVYLREGDKEIRYDSEMNIESRYIGHEKNKPVGNIIPNAVRKIESKGKKIKPTSYNVFLDHKPPLPDNFSHEEIEKITEGYNARERGIWMCKGEVKNNIIYLQVGNNIKVLN